MDPDPTNRGEACKIAETFPHAKAKAHTQDKTIGEDVAREKENTVDLWLRRAIYRQISICGRVDLESNQKFVDSRGQIK